MFGIFHIVCAPGGTAFVSSLLFACLSSLLTSQPCRGIETKVSVSSLPGSCCICDCNGLLALSRSLSVSSVSSVSSASSSSSSVRSADSEDMYADLASPVSSASSRSPTPAQQKKGRGTWFGFFLLQGVLGKEAGSRDLHTACLVVLWVPGKLLSRG